ncbi:hypothetical protein AHAS_Ahas02G0150300 [Arachis hypogaea]
MDFSRKWNGFRIEVKKRGLTWTNGLRHHGPRHSLGMTQKLITSQVMHVRFLTLRLSGKANYNTFRGG